MRSRSTTSRTAVDRRRRRAADRPEQHHDRGAELPPPGRPRGAGGQQPVRRQAEDAEEEDEAAQAVEVADLGARPQRRQDRGAGRRTRGTGSRCTATRRRRCPRATRPTRRGWPATRPSTTTPCRRTRSRPRSSFGRSSAAHARVEQMTPLISSFAGRAGNPLDGRHGRDELPRHAHDPQAAEGGAEDAAAGQRRPGHDGAAATAGRTTRCTSR